jgi:hypothetical protein
MENQPVIIEQKDLDQILAMHTGSKFFAEVLENASDEGFVKALTLYVHFNASFGGGVANLAGEIAVRQGLFQDKNEPIAFLRDRSVDVGSKIFFAAVDEFGDRSTSNLANHRTLAKATLKGVAKFFNVDLETLSSYVQSHQTTETLIQKVKDGYGINRTLNHAELFRAIGFHIGSEMLADQEFLLIDACLRKKYPSLIKYLQETKIEVDGAEHDAYAWIRIHTTVEAEHFAAATASANMALQYSATGRTPQSIKENILEGFRNFSFLQTDFMGGLVQVWGE